MFVDTRNRQLQKRTTQMLLRDLAELTLTAGGTAQAITTEATALDAESFSFYAPSTNSGTVYIGSASVSSTRFAIKLAPGEKASISTVPSRADERHIDGEHIYWDGTTGDKLNVGYLKIGA